MLAALLRYRRRDRPKIARVWAYRSHAAQAAKRLERAPDFATLAWRAKQDRRGQLVREGVTYRGDGRVIPWRIVRSVRGRTDQFDILVAGTLWRTAGARRLQRWLGRVS